jgi:hypothetical protein
VGFSTRDPERRTILTTARKLLRNRLTLLLALLAVLGVTLAGPQPAAVASCPDAARAYYYSDATHSTQVGTCWHSCCQLWTCTGEITDYYTVFTRPCDFN